MAGESSFSIDEIRKQLENLGYKGVGDDRLCQFQHDLSKLMSSDATGDYSSTETANQIKILDLSTEDTDELTLLERSDMTSYNPLPEVTVPRQIYIDDTLEKSLDELDGFQLKEPISNSDSESVKTEDLLLYSKGSTHRMKRKISKKIEYGDSYVTVTDSSLSLGNSIVSTSSTDFEISEMDDELRQRLHRLKININSKETPLGDYSNRPEYQKAQKRPFTSQRRETRVKFEEQQNENIDKRPLTAPPRLHSERPPAFLRPDLSIKQKSSPVDLYYKYKGSWDKHKMPTGDHGQVRREIRNICYDRDPEPIRPRRQIKPSSYVVPTTKKRQAMRWDVRVALHNREMIKK